MGIGVTPDYILLEQMVDDVSRFVSEGESNRYSVVFSNMDSDFYKGQEVYLLNPLGKITIDGKELTVANTSEVIAYVA